jgi:type I restriction enzyme S subunit
MSSELAHVSLDDLTDGTPITYGVVKPGDEAENGVAFVRGGDVLGGRVLVSQLRTISSEVSAQYARTLLRGGELLMSLVGNPGEVAIAPPSLRGANIARQVGLIRIDPGKADANYVQCFLRSRVGRDLLLAHSKGSVQQVINLRDLKSIRVPLPSLAVQKEVSSLVVSFDDRVALLRETNATLEAIAQALFKSWFIDFDPVRAKSQGLAPAGMDEATAALFPDGFEKSALGLVPKGWEQIDLAELTERFGGTIQTGPFGSQLHASDYVESGVPVVMPKDIINRRASTQSIARVGVADAHRLSRHRIQAGDIVFSRRGDVERHALVTEREAGWLCGTGCLLLRPGAKWTAPGFLSMLLDAPQARTWLVQHAVGATMPNLNTGILGSVPVLLPSRGVLAAFENLVAVTEEQRSRNESMAETLATIRDTLLPRLISGQLRLPEAEAMMEEVPA